LCFVLEFQVPPLKDLHDLRVKGGSRLHGDALHGLIERQRAAVLPIGS
jgi:hypothetical protein